MQPIPSATVFNSSHQVISAQVTWTSSDAAVASLPGGNAVRFVKIGRTTFVASAGSVSASLKVSVVREPVRTVVIVPGTASLQGTDSLQFRAWAAGPAEDSLAGRTVALSTHSTTIISLASTGMVHSLGTGTAYIIGTSEGVTDSVALAVDARLVARIVVTPNPLHLLPGTSSQAWIWHTYDANGTEMDRPPTWTSSDTTIATVDANGAVAIKAGSATLTAHADTATLRVPLTIAPVSFASVTAGGAGNGCALTASQDAYCWGGNTLGELGTTDSGGVGVTGPSLVLGGHHYTSIVAGETLTCALADGGVVYCWGGMDFAGQGSRIPRVVSGVNLTSLNLSGNRACGVNASGTAYCWGGNDFGNLFTIPTNCGSDCRTTAVATGGSVHWQKLSAGDGWHVCGVDASNAAQCWGVNASGQLGDGSLTDESLPVAVQGGLSFAEVSAGEATTCGLTVAGAAYCWGSDRYGSLGSGTAMASCNPPPFEFNPCSLTPREVAGSHVFSQIGVGHEHACGLSLDSSVWCWGFSVAGDGTPTVPVAIAGGMSFTSISVNNNNCGMASDGRAYCWQRFEAPVRVAGQQ